MIDDGKKKKKENPKGKQKVIKMGFSVNLDI